MAMEFRAARPEELDEIFDIILEGKRALAAQGLDQWQGGNPTRAAIAGNIAEGFTHVAVDTETGAILGTVAICDNGEADYDLVREGAWLTESPNTPGNGPVRYIVLHRLAVAAGAKRRGVATFILERSLEIARERGFASVRVDTHEGNLPMQGAFLKCGMERCCVIEITNPLEITKKRIGFEIVL